MSWLGSAAKRELGAEAERKSVCTAFVLQQITSCYDQDPPLCQSLRHALPFQPPIVRQEPVFETQAQTQRLSGLPAAFSADTCQGFTQRMKTEKLPL